ncbi:hypothetical protein [Pedobacter sp. MW01-1-1]|uniref:hypothetical protein n=1 Tax=Pedobacter sp. MW01-1-1 TaxID=3383027 RepID=UPI003FF0FF56
MLEDANKIQKERIDVLKHLYDQYGGMVMGYMFGVVKERNLAQEYLIQFFSEISTDFFDAKLTSAQVWCALYKLAKSYLSMVLVKGIGNEAAGTAIPVQGLQDLSSGHRAVFHSVYNGEMAITELSDAQSTHPDEVKKMMRETFITMRNAG